MSNRKQRRAMARDGDVRPNEVRCCGVAILYHIPDEVIKADEEAYYSGKIENPTETFPQEYKDRMFLSADIAKKHMTVCVYPLKGEIEGDVMYLWIAPKDEQRAIDFYNECRENGIDARLVKNAVYIPSAYAIKNEA